MAVIANTYLPFDAGAGSAVAESGWRSMAKHWLASGPLVSGAGGLDALKPTAGAGLQVLVALGEAWVQGHWASWTGQSTLTPGANSSGSTRVDAIVIRADFVDNNVELDLVAGTPGAGLPALTQSSSIWEILIGSSTLVSGGTSVTVADLRKLAGADPPGPPRFRVTGGAGGQTGVAHSANATCTWANGTEVTDTEGAIAIGTGVFTCPAAFAGRWRFDFQVAFEQYNVGIRASWLEHSVGPRRYAQSSQINQGGAGAESISGSVDIVLAASDTVKVVVFHTAGVARTVNANADQHFQGRYIGPA